MREDFSKRRDIKLTHLSPFPQDNANSARKRHSSSSSNAIISGENFQLWVTCCRAKNRLSEEALTD